MPRARTCGRSICTTAWPSSTSSRGSYRPLDSIPVPLDVLGEIEGRDDSPVVFEAAEPDRTVIRWQDHGIPQVRDCPVTPFGNIAPFPETPTAWTQAPADLLAALAEASEICTDESTRYALNCIQLRGTVHKIIATDGHQLLVRSGFGFPWDGDLLIKGSPIFACKALNRDQSVQIGKTDTHVVLRIGPWTIWNEIQKDARFPGVEEAIPGTDAVLTRLQLDPEDARFLQAALDRLPGNEELNSPATIDMNGKVAIRARGCRAVADHRAGPRPFELFRPADPHQHQPKLPEAGHPARLQRDRHLGRGDAGGLSGAAPGLRVAAPQRRCGDRAG